MDIRSRAITTRARLTLDRLARERKNTEGDRGAVVRHMELLAKQNPYDKGMQWAADIARRALAREQRHG